MKNNGYSRPEQIENAQIKRTTLTTIPGEKMDDEPLLICELECQSANGLMGQVFN